jgi:hypothetical protein
VVSNAELLASPQLDSNQDFTTPRVFPEQVTSQTEFPPSLNLGGEVFPTEPYVGQATVAGVYGMGDNWSDFCASHPMPKLWSSTSSHIEPSCNASSVVPDFKTNAASFSMGLPGTVNHFNATPATTNLPLKPQTFSRSGLPRYDTQYNHQLSAQDHGFKPGHSSPAIVPHSIYTPEQFASLELESMDLLTDMAASNHSYDSPDIGLA